MFRTSDIVMIAIMVSAAASTYVIKRQSEDQLDQVRKLEAQLRFERDSIDLLQADWSLLTQPARLQTLTDLYQNDLELKPVEATQFARMEELPERQLKIEDILKNPGAIASDPASDPIADQINTGAIR